MSIGLDCPLCQQHWSVGEDQEGRRTRCPGCGEVYYVPQEDRLAARPGAAQPARRSRLADEDDRSERELALAGAGNSRGLLLGLTLGAGGVLLVGVIVLAVVLARSGGKGGDSSGRPGDQSGDRGRPAVAADNPNVTVEKFRTIRHTATLAQIEAMIGPAALLTRGEMRTTLSHQDCVRFCNAAQADTICNSPKVGLYQWKNGRNVIHLAITPNQDNGVLVCAVFVGPNAEGGGIQAVYCGNTITLNQLR
jgi:hypothetical protein